LTRGHAYKTISGEELCMPLNPHPTGIKMKKQRGKNTTTRPSQATVDSPAPKHLFP